ncbi:hypothetical protein HER10_EVM0008483 [Colletotrichum scovillei]|uniref:uncharacterized protein n=1 Tax=Colletotrichum scovillei TaxID=1209932 RepID=UPI0015C3A84E|nr:uncharacterized protein HER10_EVM0008483 [Colletotrichum scovillei]KAF4776739.1 hypothetical protein HER10_EVM0008483 [Colletotrichum scovillei]
MGSHTGGKRRSSDETPTTGKSDRMKKQKTKMTHDHEEFDTVDDGDITMQGTGNDHENDSEFEEADDMDGSDFDDEIDNDQSFNRGDIAGKDHPDVILGVIPEWSRVLPDWPFGLAPPDKSTKAAKLQKKELEAAQQSKKSWSLGLPPSHKFRSKDFVSKGVYSLRDYPPTGKLALSREALIKEYHDAGNNTAKRPVANMLPGARVLMETNTYTNSRGNFLRPYLRFRETYDLHEFLETGVSRVLQHFHYPWIKSYARKLKAEGKDPLNAKGFFKPPQQPRKNNIFQEILRLDSEETHQTLQNKSVEAYPSLVVMRMPEFAFSKKSFMEPIDYDKVD